MVPRRDLELGRDPDAVDRNIDRSNPDAYYKLEPELYKIHVSIAS